MVYTNKRTGQCFGDWLKIYLIKHPPKFKSYTDLVYGDVIKIDGEWKKFSGGKYAVTLPSHKGKRVRNSIRYVPRRIMVAGNYEILFDKFLSDAHITDKSRKLERSS